MKKALILVLLVVLVALGFFCYGRSKRRGFVGNPGAKHQRHDHNGKIVDTEECETLVGQHSDVCIIPISYLQEMMSERRPDTAMEVHHNETIVWVGNEGESITVRPMTGMNCAKHGEKDDPPSGSDSLLVDMKQPKPNLVFAHITNDRKNEKYCYKTNIDVTVKGGTTTTIDPHDFLEQ